MPKESFCGVSYNTRGCFFQTLYRARPTVPTPKLHDRTTQKYIEEIGNGNLGGDNPARAHFFSRPHGTFSVPGVSELRKMAFADRIAAAWPAHAHACGSARAFHFRDAQFPPWESRGNINSSRKRDSEQPRASATGQPKDQPRAQRQARGSHTLHSPSVSSGEMHQIPSTLRKHRRVTGIGSWHGGGMGRDGEETGTPPHTPLPSVNGMVTAHKAPPGGGPELTECTPPIPHHFGGPEGAPGKHVSANRALRMENEVSRDSRWKARLLPEPIRIIGLHFARARGDNLLYYAPQSLGETTADADRTQATQSNLKKRTRTGRAVMQPRATSARAPAAPFLPVCATPWRPCSRGATSSTPANIPPLHTLSQRRRRDPGRIVTKTEENAEGGCQVVCALHNAFLLTLVILSCSEVASGLRALYKLRGRGGFGAKSGGL
eukprot:gene15938-biopygen12768